MRRLIESVLVSLDGVTGAPERWANFDAEDAALSMEELGNYDAFVMGRVTYENFFANWGHVAGNPYIDLINAMPKYVASRSLTQTTWNATLLGPDPSSAIARLKDQPGKDLIKYGTSRFDNGIVWSVRQHRRAVTMTCVIAAGVSTAIVLDAVRGCCFPPWRRRRFSALSR